MTLKVNHGDEPAERGVNDDGAHDPQDTIWSVYISHTTQMDKALAERWKADMEGILIFAGLFSAVLTAFVSQTYKNLQPDTDDATVLLLSQISQQLANSSFVIPTPAPFKPDPYAFRVNLFWFLSLAFSISCALAATLVQQWARNYQESLESHTVPNKRARIRGYLQEGIRIFKIRTLVKSIPVLLHISVALFMAGLLDFLRSINTTIAYLTSSVVCGFIAIYIIFTVLPVFFLHCPYQTPLSGMCWKILQTFYLLRFRNDKGKLAPFRRGLSLYRVHVATKPSAARRRRDENALQYLLESFTRDADFESVISGIPDFLSSHDDNPGIAFWEKFQTDDIALCTRITNLLITCQSGGVLPETTRQRRAQICLNAIWSLTQSSLLTSHDLRFGSVSAAPQISAWSISQASVAAIAAFKYDHSPSVAIYVSCAVAVVSCKILEHWAAEQDVDLLETLQVLELLDIYKFLPREQKLSIMQQRKREWEVQQKSANPVHELKQDPILEQKLKSELNLLKQDGYFGVLIAFVSALSDIANLSILSGLPLARRTLDVIISLFPSVSPGIYTQRLLVNCLRRAIGNEGQSYKRLLTEQSDDIPLMLSPNLRQNSSDSAASISLPPPTKLPISLIDRILPSVAQSLSDPGCLEEVKVLVSAYRENYSQSVAATRTLSILQAKMDDSEPLSGSIRDELKWEDSELYATVN